MVRSEEAVLDATVNVAKTSIRTVYTRLMLTRLWLALSVLTVASFGLSQQEVFTACSTAVGPVVLDGPPDPATSKRMRVIYDEDQAARMAESIDWEVLNRDDAARQVEVMGYLKDGKLTTGADFYYAAFIFQHGNCPEHYKLANRLAARAIALNYTDARWIYAATLDRYLLSQGEKQKFGTQYTSTDGCTYVLEPVDPATTDAERAKYNVPSLVEAKAATADIETGDCSDTGN